MSVDKRGLSRIYVRRELLERLLARLEEDWGYLEKEWGPYMDKSGKYTGLEGAIADGEETLIPELRKILKGADV